MIKNNQKGSGVLVLLIILLLTSIGAAGYFVYKSNTSAPENSDNKTASNIIKCDTDKCFQEKFVKCQPANLQQEAVVAGGAKAYYEIVGGDTANCKMLYRTDSDNLDLICAYQDMDSYDTGQDDEFVLAAATNENDIAFGKETNCTGPKVQKLQQS